jgi:hypothetical protein
VACCWLQYILTINRGFSPLELHPQPCSESLPHCLPPRGNDCTAVRSESMTLTVQICLTTTSAQLAVKPYARFSRFSIKHCPSSENLLDRPSHTQPLSNNQPQLSPEYPYPCAGACITLLSLTLTSLCVSSLVYLQTSPHSLQPVT